MVSTTSFALASVPLVAFGYLATSFAYCEVERRRERGEDRLRNVPETTIVSLVALLTAALALYVTDWVADPELGYVAAQVPDALVPWQEVAVWTAVAAVLGHVAPVWNGFRGGSGVAPAAILAFAFMPVVLLVALFGWFAGMVVSKRSRAPVRIALVAAVLTAWAAWIFGVEDAWGVPLGGESLVAVVVVVGLVLARAHVDRSRAAAQ